jgi:PHD/YefM family antitoxin component YafN of YafNO toxin-antitoxin module
MIAMDDYASLLETLDVLSNTRLAKRIKKAEADIAAGRVKALDKIEKELGIV